MQRLKNEETESELVRYKLLYVHRAIAYSFGCEKNVVLNLFVHRYAESAMQQNEEALSHRRSILSGSSFESR